MKQIILIIILTISIHVHGQEKHYYWAGGKKIYLTVNPNKHFVIFEKALSSEKLEKLTKDNGLEIRRFSKEPEYLGLKQYNNRSSYMTNSWAIIEQTTSKPFAILSSLPDILYSSPYYVGFDDEDVGVSHLF